MKQGKQQDKKKGESNFDLAYPVIILTVICIIVSGLLAFTNSATAPKIEAAIKKAAEETRLELLPEASEFTEIECAVENVKSVFKDAGGSGYVITAAGKGYKGPVLVTVGVKPDGTVIGIKVDSSVETANVGTRVSLPEFTDRFKGLKENADAIDVLAGATYSSRAVKSAVNSALAALDAVKEG